MNRNEFFDTQFGGTVFMYWARSRDVVERIAGKIKVRLHRIKYFFWDRASRIKGHIRLARMKRHIRRTRNSRDLVRLRGIAFRPCDISLIIPNDGDGNVLVVLSSGVELKLDGAERYAAEMYDWWNDVAPRRWTRYQR